MHAGFTVQVMKRHREWGSKRASALRSLPVPVLQEAFTWGKCHAGTVLFNSMMIIRATCTCQVQKCFAASSAAHDVQCLMTQNVCKRATRVLQRTATASEPARVGKPAHLHCMKSISHVHDVYRHSMLQAPSPCGQKLNQSCCAQSKVDGHDQPFCSSSSLVCLALNGNVMGARCQTYDKDCGLLGQKACPIL